ncbi:MAG: hypothetical protein GY928_02310 [Colwellia sp.]|nr:hypothetical protein [Colwellia sp.]
MKLSTFENRTKENSKNSNGYGYAKCLLTTKKRVYTCHTSGSGRFTTNTDGTDAAIKILQDAGLKLNIDFVTGNDSPRGGKTGNYVELTTKGKTKAIQ